jgi:ribonucleoside-diphosphate reductase alpha chain
VSASGGAGAMSASTNAGVGKAAAGSGLIVMPAATDIAGPVCMLKPGDTGFEDCEACQ